MNEQELSREELQKLIDSEKAKLNGLFDDFLRLEDDAKKAQMSAFFAEMDELKRSQRRHNIEWFILGTLCSGTLSFILFAIWG